MGPGRRKEIKLSSQETVTESHDSDYPRSWRWDEDGLRIAGTYVEMNEGPSEYGRRAICVLQVGGERRSLWLTQEALISKFREELERRELTDFTVGERIEVERGAEKKQSANGRGYWPFTVRFPDAPHKSAAELLGSSAEPADAQADDLPF
jgi:hypothetical protein